MEGQYMKTFWSREIWKISIFTCALVVGNMVGVTLAYAQDSSTKNSDVNSTSQSTIGFFQGKGYQVGRYDVGAASPTPFNWTRQSQINLGQSLEYKWSADIGGEGISPPVTASDGTIYVRSWGDSIEGQTKAYLKAINKEGSIKWSIPVGTDTGSAPVITSEGIVIIGDSNGLYGYNSDGTQKFFYPTNGSIHSTPSIGSDGTIYVMDTYGIIYAVQPDGTGEVIFRSYSNFGSSDPQTIVIDRDGTQYFKANGSGSMYAMDQNGNRKWLYSTYSGSISTPAIGEDGTVYVGIQIFSNKNWNLYAFNSSGNPKWGFKLNGRVSPTMSPVISNDGTIYIGDDSTIYAVNPDGTLKWSIQTQMNATPILGADGTLFVNSLDSIKAISPDGEIKWSAAIAPETGVNVPLSIGNNGTLYGYATNGKLYAYQDIGAPSVPIVNEVGDKETSVSGNAEAKSIVTLKAGTRVLGTTIVDYDGTFTVPIEWQKAGTKLTVTAADSAGNVSEEAYITVIDKIRVVNRISGEDRMGTAMEIAQKGWKKADTVLIATGYDFPDALAGAPLAYQLDAPILLTSKQGLSQSTKQEISNLGATKAIILGGPGAVPSKVEEQLNEFGIINIDRLAGRNRFETAGLIAVKMGGHPKTAILADGYNYPDALSVASYAAQNGFPILLTQTESLPSVTSNNLDGKTKTIVVGGEAAISNKVFTSVPGGERIGGLNRFETTANIVTKLQLSTDKAFIATGRNFADALTGSVLAAKENAPVLLVEQNSIPAPIHNLIVENDIQSIDILGGKTAVSELVEEQLKN